jgi:hypothetical protein
MKILQNCPMLRYEGGYYILKQEINIAIQRHQTVIDALFTGVVMFLVTIGTLCIGCDLEIEQIVNNIKQPKSLIIGLACQIIYLPLLSLLISNIFGLDNSTNLGLISTAGSPSKLDVKLLKFHKKSMFRWSCIKYLYSITCW